MRLISQPASDDQAKDRRLHTAHAQYALIAFGLSCDGVRTGHAQAIQQIPGSTGVGLFVDAKKVLVVFKVG